MVRNFSADYIIPVSGEPVKQGVVSVNESGEIIKVYDRESASAIAEPIERHKGIIVPGFVNTHCHLELSHLHQKFPANKGLISFIKSVMAERKATEKEITDAMLKADKAMAENGIVAVGDNVNTALSKDIKANSSIYYHTFVELLGFEPEKAKEVFENGIELKEKFAPLSASVAPHASYSVCKELFKEVREYCNKEKNLLTIHNQESEEENKFYRYKTGGFIDFYKDQNLDISFYKPQARDSLQSIIPLIPKGKKILLVHNIYTSLKDVYFVRRFGRDINWCFCPNANLFIENRLPKIDMFLFDDFNITIGTDSLASNNKLCMLSEIQTINKHFPSIPLTTTLKWATLNGARFLGIDRNFGSIEEGKTPGLNLITEIKDVALTPESKVQKLL